MFKNFMVSLAILSAGVSSFAHAETEGQKKCHQYIPLESVRSPDMPKEYTNQKDADNL